MERIDRLASAATSPTRQCGGLVRTKRRSMFWEILQQRSAYQGKRCEDRERRGFEGLAVRIRFYTCAPSFKGWRLLICRPRVYITSPENWLYKFCGCCIINILVLLADGCIVNFYIKYFESENFNCTRSRKKKSLQDNIEISYNTRVQCVIFIILFM